MIKTIKCIPKNIEDFPYNLSLFQETITLDVDTPVTILVGENGSGKSTFLKLIQSRLSLVEIRLPKQEEKPKFDKKTISITPSLGRIKGFFFESLSFIKYIDYIQKEIADSKDEIKRVDETYQNRSDYAKSLAKSPFYRTISELTNMYERDLSKSSHGEAYLDFFASRIKDNQLYLLDEPETPLSVQNQLSLLSMIIEATKRGCQFIIATHSPILTAFPEAKIYEIQDHQFVLTSYEEIKSIQLLKQFLNQKEQFLRHLK